MWGVRAVSLVAVASVGWMGGTAATPAAAATTATAMSPAVAPAVAPATFALGADIAVIGDRTNPSNTAAISKYFVAGPAAGTPKAQVNATAKTVTITVDDPAVGGSASVTMAWPARPGMWSLSQNGVDPEQAVRLSRDAGSCLFLFGNLTVHRAEMTATGQVAALSADVTGSCQIPGRAYYAGALVRLGDSDPARSVSLPRATPASFSTGAAAGTVVNHEVTLSNSGPKPWKVGDVVVGSGSSSVPRFAIVPNGNGCTGLTLATGQTCTVRVTATSTNSSIREYVMVGGDHPTTLVVPIALEGYAPVEAPTAASVAPGRLSATLSWQPPSTLPREGYRVYDVAGGARTLVATAPSAATSVLVPGAGPRQLALVAANGRFAESPDLAVDTPVVASELVANDWYGSAVAFVPGGAGTDAAARPLGVERIDLDPSRTRWVTAARSDISVCQVATEQCVTVPGTSATTTDANTAREAKWLPDGSIAFLRGGLQDENLRTLWVVRTDGSGLRKVASVPQTAQLASTPNGTEVVMHSFEGFGRLLRVNLTTGAITPIPGTDWIDDFTVTTRGQLVVESRDDTSLTNGSRTTTLMNLDGSGARRLALPVGDNREATFDQAGTQVAFARYTADQESTLWVAAADGTSARQISTASKGWIDLNWSVGDLHAPSATVTVPAYTTRSATLAIGAADADDTLGSLRRQCRLDSATAWSLCNSTMALTNLAAGTHTLRAQVTDPSGLQSPIVTKTWIVDAVAPTTAVMAPLQVQTSATMNLAWSAVDSGGSGLATYDVRVRTASPTSGFGAYQYPATWQKRTSRSLPVTPTKGYQYCFSVRSRDRAGNVGAFSAERCTSMPLDDRDLTVSSGWTRGTSSSYLFSTYTRTVRTSAQLTRASVSGRRLALVAATCPTCGSVDVFHAGVKVGRVSLYSSTTKLKQVKWLTLQSVTRKGTVTIRSIGTRPVVIDGLAIAH